MFGSLDVLFGSLDMSVGSLDKSRLRSISSTTSSMAIPLVPFLHHDQAFGVRMAEAVGNGR